MSVGELVPAELHAQAVAWRRRLHSHPEVAFGEHETSRFVEETLRSFGGLEIERPTPTSVLARLRADAPGKVLALRADMDALPIQEENDVPYASTRPGAMHACGHDGHTAMLLAAARELVGRRDEFAGEVRFLFQHAEEVQPGGAAQLVDAGVMDGVDMVVGTHLMSGIDVGKTVVVRGPAMAAADTFALRIRGRGGHAAMPQLLVDPVVIAAQVVTAFQGIVSRSVSPLDSAVVSVTRISGGTATNVIPEEVSLAGTIRTFTEENRVLVRRRMDEIVAGITAAHGGSHALEHIDGCGAVVNDTAVAAYLEDLVVRDGGEDAIGEHPPMMGGEDFSAYLDHAPGAFVWIGCRNEEIGASYPHHHPRFAIDEEAMKTGIALFQRVALDFLAGVSRAR
jgi:amidohydrolase